MYMDGNTKIELATSEIARLERELIRLTTEMDRLRSLKGAWETIRDVELGTAPNELIAPSGLRLPFRPNGTSEEQLEATAAYGDKTQALRRQLVKSQGLGLTRHQVVEASKALSAHANFPYRFIARMLDSDELVEKDGRYLATNKMIARFNDPEGAN